jgi:hypothetical protein
MKERATRDNLALVAYDTICGPEFGEFTGRIGIIVKALYGLKSSGYAWRTHLAENLKKIGFLMCMADNDVWMRAATRIDGTEYYEYVLVYTDDILAISMTSKDILNQLDQHYVLKPGSVGKPTQYLGAQIGEFRIPSDPEKIRWSMSSEKYVKEAIRNVQDWLAENNFSRSIRLTFWVSSGVGCNTKSLIFVSGELGG